MLYERRKRQEDLARRESAGESLWDEGFDEPARVRLVHCLQALSTARGETTRYLRRAHQLICSELGLFHFDGDPGAVSRGQPEKDLIAGLLQGDAERVATIIESVWLVLAEQLGSDTRYNSTLGGFRTEVATILAEHRVAFELIDGQMVPFSSRELHVEVVEPTLRLLGGRASWEGVERAYRKALEELGSDPGDAITDAGTALQEALTQLGCKGNALGPLAASAVEKGLLSGHDRKLVDWVSADRSQTGDAHNSAPASRDDAWFTVHIVGALLLRLASGGTRA